MFNIVDIIFIILILIFAITACAKGFVKELFNKISWIMGVVLAVIFAKKLQPYLLDLVKNEFFALVCAFFLIFIVVFLIVQIVKTIIGHAFEGEIMKGLDKALGFFLGLAEGLLVVFLLLTLVSGQTVFAVNSILGDSFFYKLFLPILPTPAALLKKDFA